MKTSLRAMGDGRFIINDLMTGGKTYSQEILTYAQLFLHRTEARAVRHRMGVQRQLNAVNNLLRRISELSSVFVM